MGLLVAVVLIALVAAALFGMVAAWGSQWSSWPGGLFNGPRLGGYGVIAAAIALDAGLGRLFLRGTTYVVGLALVIVGSLFLGYVWFVVGLFTGLRL